MVRKVPVIIIIRFAENNALGPINIYQFQGVGVIEVHTVPYKNEKMTRTSNEHKIKFCILINKLKSC